MTNDPAPGKGAMDVKDWVQLVHLDPDDAPLFMLTKEHDFGAAATAVATKITDAAPCNGEILAALFILTEAKAGGSGDDVSCIAKDSGASTKMTGDVTLDMSDTVYMNHLKPHRQQPKPTASSLRATISTPTPTPKPTGPQGSTS